MISAMTVKEYLESKSIDPAKAIVEIDGEVYPVGFDFSQMEFKEGMKVEAFRIVAGG